MIDPTRLFVVFSLAKSEFVDQLLEVFYVLDYGNTGARVMFLVLPADFVGQLLEVFHDPGWVSVDKLLGFLFPDRRAQGGQ